MGVVYKLSPKISQFLLEQKKKNTNLSCRKASNLILKKFKIKLSKSSISNLIKKSGLSSPIGRRRKLRRKLRLEIEQAGVYLLKKIDLFFGGSLGLNQAIKRRLPKKEDQPVLESLLYAPLFKHATGDDLPADSNLWAFLGKKLSPQILNTYLNDLQLVTALKADLSEAIAQAFKEVWFIKVSLMDNHVFYLDGEFRTIWSTPHIPYDFSSTLYKSNSYINSFLSENVPLVLFAAPGYDTPTREFFELLLTQENDKNRIVKFTLYGSKMEELESIRPRIYEKRHYIFGLWPWQFERFRKVKITSEFKAFYFEPLERDFYLAEAELELLQPKIEQSVRMRGCILKAAIDGKIKLIISTNLPLTKVSIEEVASAYLNHWPNLEEGFTDFSRKIELFTYTAASRKTFSPEESLTAKGEPQDIKGAFGYYLSGLDLYLRSRILPSEYEKIDFSTMKERFYNLKAKVKATQGYQLVSFILPAGYPFRKDLLYACNRLNEKEAITTDGKRLWFVVSV